LRRGGGPRTSARSYIVWLTMRREIGSLFALLALVSACSGNEASKQASSERTTDLASELHRPLNLPTVLPGVACSPDSRRATES
jgi:hypothetical protein